MGSLFCFRTLNDKQKTNQQQKAKEGPGCHCRECICCSLLAKLCLTLCHPMKCSKQGFPVHHQLPELAQTHVHWVGDAIQPSHPLSPSSPPAFNLSQHQDLFKWVSCLIRWPKYWSFSFNIIPSNEYSGLISFRMDWFGLLAVQGTDWYVSF